VAGQSRIADSIGRRPKKLDPKRVIFTPARSGGRRGSGDLQRISVLLLAQVNRRDMFVRI
jgi:hypothetical protein